jgi:hypothetical protein
MKRCFYVFWQWKNENDQKPTRYNILPQNVLKAFSAILIGEGRCRQWVIDQLHPDGWRCPKWGYPKTLCQTLFSYEISFSRYDI